MKPMPALLCRSCPTRMIISLLVAAYIVIGIAGCAVVDGGPAAPPSNVANGIHTHEFIDKAPFLFDKKYVDVSSTYKGQWAGNRPKGQGEVTSSYGLSCRGEFGIEPTTGYFAKPVYPDFYYTGASEKSVLAREYYVWARGDVFYQGKLIFTGLFRNKFYWGEGCLPAGDGVWFDSGSRITGKFWTDLSTREEEKRVLIRHFMLDGPCQIARKDGALYTGNCDAPDKSKSKKGSVYLKTVDLSDPFILADGTGTFTEANGRVVAGAQAKSKADDMRRQLLERERERIAQERAEQRERQEAERMRREAEESGPSTASQIALFGSLMASNYQQQQSLRAAEAAANQRRLDAVQAAERRTAQRNDQMLASVAEERRAAQQKQQYQQTQSAGNQPSQAKPVQTAQAESR